MVVVVDAHKGYWTQRRVLYRLRVGVVPPYKYGVVTPRHDAVVISLFATSFGYGDQFFNDVGKVDNAGECDVANIIGYEWDVNHRVIKSNL